MSRAVTRRRLLGALPALRADGEFPWPYKRIEPAEAAERAYEAFLQAGCMFSAFDGVLGLLAGKHGEPYSGFPRAMMSYGDPRRPVQLLRRGRVADVRACRAQEQG